MPTPNQPTQAEKRKHRYQIEIGDRVEMIHRDDPYHPGRDPNVGKVGTVTSVVDGAWGERATFKADDGTTVNASTSELLHAEPPAPKPEPECPTPSKATPRKPKNTLLRCADGFTMSVQASERHYCEPRNDHGPYTKLEVAFPSTVEPLLLPFQDSAGYKDPTEDVYGWVPTEVIDEVIEGHGGLIEGKLPPRPPAKVPPAPPTQNTGFTLDAKAAINNEEITFMNPPTSLDDWAMIVCLEHQDYWIEYNDTCNGSDGPGYTIFGTNGRTQFVGLDLTDAKIELARWILGGAVKQEPTTTQRFAIMLMGSQGAPACMLPNGERVCLTVAGGKERGLRSVFFYHTESEASQVLFDAHQAVINKDNWPAGYDSAGLADRIDSAVIVSMQVTP